MKLPMSTVTELLESVKEYGLTIEDYDYLNISQGYYNIDNNGYKR